MKQIPDESVDLIVTDPPYLMNYKTNRRKDKSHMFCTPISGDNDSLLIQLYISECYRIMKNNTAMYMFCNSNKIDFFKTELEKTGFKIKNIIIWIKNNWTAGDLKAQFGKQYEMIILVNKGRKFFNGKRLTDVWYFDRVSGKKQLHQNQKPIELLEQCIRKHSDENDIVFDGFAGSGSTGEAALRTGRKFLGIEIDKNYFNIANKRLERVEQEIK
ncbi:site-specific DNA-methyltransferase [Thomasclavelia cocleata]|nr:DNA methyltransferase [Thomasclavelia cocleata]NDO43208.1 site-specific DNA-methyltransferase [Thomasclavelia cocleata]PJN80042.1 site-specific DNA-methyltransferase [Thomasclavelia cocleata]